LISVGPPSAPGDVIVTENGVAENGVGSLNVSWSLADISLIPVSFIITAINLNNSGESVNATTQDLFQVISSPNNATSCDVYEFQVTAVNSAGANSSSFLFSTFPSLPTLVAEDAVQTFLVKSANETVSLLILINVSTTVTVCRGLHRTPPPPLSFFIHMYVSHTLLSESRTPL
jgi:hypothetical protein